MDIINGSITYIPLRAKPQRCADQCSQYRLVSDHRKILPLIINEILVKRQSSSSKLVIDIIDYVNTSHR